MVFNDAGEDCFLGAVWVEVPFFGFWEEGLEEFTDSWVPFRVLSDSVELSCTGAKDLDCVSPWAGIEALS